jgi:hypothetical protein
MLVVLSYEVIYKIWFLNENFIRIFLWQDDFKLKCYQLQSFITFQDLQVSFWWFFIWDCLKKMNFNYAAKLVVTCLYIHVTDVYISDVYLNNVTKTDMTFETNDMFINTRH